VIITCCAVLRVCSGAVDAATTMVRTEGVISLYKGLALNSSPETLGTPETQSN
jgi:hypothetical protein